MDGSDTIIAKPAERWKLLLGFLRAKLGDGSMPTSCFRAPKRIDSRMRVSCLRRVSQLVSSLPTVVEGR